MKITLATERVGRMMIMGSEQMRIMGSERMMQEGEDIVQLESVRDFDIKEVNMFQK